MCGGRIMAMSWTVGRAKRITDAWYYLDREPNFWLTSLALQMLLVCETFVRSKVFNYLLNFLFVFIVAQTPSSLAK